MRDLLVDLAPDDEVEDLSLWFVAEGPLLERKVRALECQVSQIGPMIAMAGRDNFKLLNADETYRDPAPGDW